MSTFPPSNPTTVAADPSALRIVLFGMPDAGKTSLLGALVQASHSQDRVLHGRLLDTSSGLADLWHRIYEERQRETAAEIAPYPVSFDPYPGDPEGTARLNAVFYDCDGRVANDLLAQRKPLDEDSGGLAKAVLDADTLILAVDASANDEQLQTDFREFARFLRVLQTHRSDDREVGGLPVYIALTKCDLLARGPIPHADWEARIVERERQVKDQFAAYLERASASAESPAVFGSIDLDYLPTAVKRPALAETPAQPREPFGVAELFHDCLRSAQSFRRRSISSDRRLKGILAASGGFLAIAAAATMFLFQTGSPLERPSKLTAKVEQFQIHEKPLPARLATDTLQSRANELFELRDDPEFGQLADDLRNYVRGRIDELEAYLHLREQLAQIARPEKARNLAELDQINSKMETQAAVPPAHQKDWKKTAAVIERQHRLNQIQAIRDAVDELRAFYSSLKNKANDRLFDAEFHTRWDEQTNAVFELEKALPFERIEPVKGAAYDFDEVLFAEKDWLAVRQRLEQLRDLGLALGLIGDSSLALLAIPLVDDADLDGFAKIRLEKLAKSFPNRGRWNLADVPDSLQGELRKKLKRSHDQMLRDGQRAILTRFRKIKPSGDDSPKDWPIIGEWLASAEMKNWAALFGFVSKLLDSSKSDPVGAAAAFSKKDRFELQIRAVTIPVPNNLPQGPLMPDGALRIRFQSSDKDIAPTVFAYRIDKLATVDGTREKRYTFKLESGDGRVAFKPGDQLSAELQFTKGEKVWQFSWANSRTASYSFDALTREPFIHVAGPIERGTLADGVILTIDGSFPAVPDLLPMVRR